MQRLNQPAKTECCSGEGQAGAPLEGAPGRTTPERRTQEASRAASGSRTPLKQFSLETCSNADGEGVSLPEPNTEEAVEGEASEGLPGSKSVAREERVCGNLGGPSASRRSNCENQPGRPAQRQGARLTSREGVRSVHISPGQPRVLGADADEGADTNTQPAQETGSARKAGKDWQTSLRAIATKAVQDRKHRFGGLYSLLNEASLTECFFQLRKQAAPGVDGVTFTDYGKNLEGNIRALVQQLKSKSYRARLVRRQYIPKENGKMRPLGIPALEDKLLQYAVARILMAIYEADFLPCSYGYRPGRGPHDATEALEKELFGGKYQFVVEADIKGFFDHIQHEKLLEMLALRIGDGALLRLIKKWLKAGILEKTGEVIHPQSGTPQGGIVSPVLANVYLHYVLDLWFEHRVRKGNQGQCKLFRYADDFVAGFDYRHEALAFEKALVERLRTFGLEVAPEKTQTLRFGRNGRQHNGRFDFLGFQFHWKRTRKGYEGLFRRTSRKKLRSSVARFTEWIKTQRMFKLRDVMQSLKRKYAGYWNYYGVRGNSKSLGTFYYQTLKLTHKWLNRRSQKRSYTWPAFNRLLKRHGITGPRIRKPERPRPAEMELFGFHFPMASAWRM